MEQIYVQQFVALKESTRNKIRDIFRIPRTSYAEVVTDHMGVGTVMCDGTTNIDLQQLTIQKMVDFLGTAAIDESINNLFKRCVEKIETPETIQTSTPVKELVIPIVVSSTSDKKDDIKTDSSVEGGVIKCSKCAFESKSKFVMRMHVGKKHK